ncbi:MAG: DUF3187 family protein [Acidobacteriota bacterium]
MPVSTQRPPWPQGAPFRGLILSILVLLAVPAGAQPSTILADQGTGAPLRLRDFTFPSFLVLGFAPTPAAALGRGNWAFELHYSKINDFQVSQAVEDYLESTRGEMDRRPLGPEDVDFILGLPEGDAFYIDGEFDFFDFALHWGVTDRLDIGASFYYIDYSGGSLDGTIFDFHDQFGYGQQGRNFVADDQFQIIFGSGETPLQILDDGEDSGGFSDPSFFIRYAFEPRGRWQFALQTGLKVPIASTSKFLSTGNLDVGVQLTADRRWGRNALILNASLVSAGEFDQTDFDPPLLPSLNVSYIRHLQRWPKARAILQANIAEHPFRDLVDSDLSEPQFQMTAGLKWDTELGVFGLALTENLLNYDNTPDIGLHFSWGFLGGHRG